MFLACLGCTGHDVELNIQFPCTLRPCGFQVMLACYLAGCLSQQFRRFLRQTFLHVGRARDARRGRPGRPGTLEKASWSPSPSFQDIYNIFSKILYYINCQIGSLALSKEPPAVLQQSSAVHPATCNSKKRFSIPAPTRKPDESLQDSKPVLVMRDSDRAVLLKPAGWEVYGQHAVCTRYILRT